jgi:hypothetical protein
MQQEARGLCPPTSCCRGCVSSPRVCASSRCCACVCRQFSEGGEDGSEQMHTAVGTTQVCVFSRRRLCGLVTPRSATWGLLCVSSRAVIVCLSASPCLGVVQFMAPEIMKGTEKYGRKVGLHESIVPTRRLEVNHMCLCVHVTAGGHLVARHGGARDGDGQARVAEPQPGAVQAAGDGGAAATAADAVQRWTRLLAAGVRRGDVHACSRTGSGDDQCVCVCVLVCTCVRGMCGVCACAALAACSASNATLRSDPTPRRCYRTRS